MLWRALLMACSLGALVLVPSLATAQGTPPGAPLPPVRIGDQFPLTFEVPLPPGATVEVDTSPDAWGAIEVISTDDIVIADFSAGRKATVTVTLAAFATGDLSVRPAVLVITGVEAQSLQLEPVTLTVVPTLPADAPLELSPLHPPSSVAGARPVWLMPAVILGSLLLVLLAALGARRALRWQRNRPRRVPAPVPVPAPPPDLSGAAAQLDSDPVAAYRQLASTVRAVLAARYSFPARSLTTAELERRMETEGVDRWQARLVGGLLEECDAVVYAGYRPAPERRHADLNMAREILEAG
jgi:hypothetical protein